MILDSSIFDELTAEAAASERLRMSRDMRNTPDDNSQRMLNALEPGTIIPVHRHRFSSETIIVLRGALCQHIYDDNGHEIRSVLLSNASGNAGMHISAGTWHTSEALEHGTIIFESKDGKYFPLTETDILSIK